jgi:hypothetical protein
MTEDLHSVRDDMIAFIEGHGMRRFQAFVNEEVPSVLWDPEDNPDSWKDFVELAKASNAAFVTMNSFDLAKDDVDQLVERLRNSTYPSEDDVEEARLMRLHTGRTGFIQLGFAANGVIFLHESSTRWYERYQSLTDAADEFGSFMFEENDSDEE